MEMAMSSKPALLCVGSGLSRRYIMNTLQALALPRGAILQFRYVEGIISEGLRKPLAARELIGATVLLGHVDCTVSGRLPNGRYPVVPYREARLRDSAQRGSVFVLQFELGPLRSTDDLESFQRTLPENSPRWLQDSDGNFTIDGSGKPKRVGHWCQEISSALPGTSVQDSFQGWQAIVTQLGQREDFARQPYFHMIEGLFRRKKGIRDGERVDLVDGEYHLDARSEYELRIFHYDPNSDAHGGNATTQTLQLGAPSLLFSMRSSPILVIDSPYDLKSVHFGTGETNRLTYGSLCLQPQGSKPEEQVVPELFFPVTIRGDSARLVGNGLVLGLLLTATQMLAVFSKGTFDGWLLVALLIVAFGLGTGFFVSFGMRKPL
jgi:hypothetical protein